MPPEEPQRGIPVDDVTEESMIFSLLIDELLYRGAERYSLGSWSCGRLSTVGLFPCLGRWLVTLGETPRRVDGEYLTIDDSLYKAIAS